MTAVRGEHTDLFDSFGPTVLPSKGHGMVGASYRGRRVIGIVIGTRRSRAFA